MSSTDIARALQHTELGQAIQRADAGLIMGAQLVHVFGLTLVLAAVLLLNLRLLRAVLADVPLPRLARAVTPLWALGLLVTVLSGSTLFLSAAMVYDANAVFWTKLGLLVAAATVQTLLIGRACQPALLPPAAAGAAAVLSLLLWAGVGIAGRAIGFV